MTPQEEQDLRKSINDAYFNHDIEDSQMHGGWTTDWEAVTDEIMALFKAEAVQVDVAARINEVHNFGNWNADKGYPELFDVIGKRLKQLRNHKKEAV